MTKGDIDSRFRGNDREEAGMTRGVENGMEGGGDSCKPESNTEIATGYALAMTRL
jgi:hypothetical protein